MLVNGKPEELKKYGKGTYNKEKFIEAIKERWELTDLQIREAYLIADLAVKADGVFSVSYGKFIKMFEERFEMEISLSSVRRFFGLLSKIGVLTINEAKRKNNKKSANIYIIEPLEASQEHVEEYSTEQTPEHVEEHSHEHTGEQIQEQDNITIKNTHKNTYKNTINLPLTTSSREIIDNQLRNKYPHVPFEEVRQKILNDDSLTIEHVNQYKGMLEYRLKRWKPNTSNKVVRKEILPSWWDKEDEKPKMSDEEAAAKRAEIAEMLAKLRSN
jgi:hypothetical protein